MTIPASILPALPVRPRVEEHVGKQQAQGRTVLAALEGLLSSSLPPGLQRSQTQGLPSPSVQSSYGDRNSNRTRKGLKKIAASCAPRGQVAQALQW